MAREPYSLEKLREEPSTLFVRELEDGRVLVSRLKLNGADLTITRPEDLPLGIASDCWEYAAGPGGYATTNDAFRVVHLAMLEWDGEGEPEGWTRHVFTGRRRPGGDATQEHVRR